MAWKYCYCTMDDLPSEKEYAMTTPRILIVEDEQIVAMDMMESLTRLGYSDIFITSDSDEALAVMDRFVPNLVLMDIRLKGSCDGVDTALKIKSAHDVPIIYITAYADDFTLQRAKFTEPFGYILKPFEERELHTAIEMALYRHRMENTLRESENKFRLLFEKSADAHLLLKNGVFIDCNSAAVRMMRCSRKEDLLGIRPHAISPLRQPDGILSVEKERTVMEQALREGSLRLEWVHSRFDGTELPVEVLLTAIPLQGEMILHTVWKDISEQKIAEEKLRSNEERYRNFFEEDLTGDFIATSDGSILAYNPAFEKIFGCIGTQCRDVNYREFFPDAASWDAFIKLIVEKKKLEYHEMELKRIDGSPVYIVENVIGSFNSRGELTQIQGYIFDDTRRKTLEQQFLKSQKMEAIGRLAGVIAHDFNNLLTVIIGYSEQLLASIGSGNDIADEIREIKKAGDRASLLTKQLLTFSRNQVLQPKVVNLNAVITNMDTMLRRLVGENIDYTTRLAPDLWPVEVDAGQMEQVLMNLVVNARDAMSGSGTLIIETSNASIDETVTQMYLDFSPGTYVLLTVSDTGCGIDKETKQHLFEPFFTTKGKGEGTGLGLSTVYGIVSQSNGRILVDSEAGRGTTFKIFLPRVYKSPDANGDVRREDKKYAGSETVLVVEDEENVRGLVSRILSMNGYRVLEARNGGDALERIRMLDGVLHMVVTDMIMPGMSGSDLIDRIRRDYPQVRVIFISGYTDSSIRDYIDRDSGVSFLQKPFTTDALASMVREMLDKK